MARLKKLYEETIAPALREEHKISNVMDTPRLLKMVINTSIDATRERDKDMLNNISEGIAMITAQRPITTRARTSVSNFRLREGMPLGAKVTLRGVRMYEFLDRLVTVALPRIRDFRGVSANGFDSNGNYNLGISDQTIFPEIDPDKITTTHGMDIAIVTTANDKTVCYDLLKRLGMPFAS